MYFSKQLLELANSIVNVEVRYNTYVGNPREVVPLENMNQAVELMMKNNKKTKSKEEVAEELKNLSAISVAVNKQTKKTSAMVTLKKQKDEVKKQIFEKAQYATPRYGTYICFISEFIEHDPITAKLT